MYPSGLDIIQGRAGAGKHVDRMCGIQPDLVFCLLQGRVGAPDQERLQAGFYQWPARHCHPSATARGGYSLYRQAR